MSKVEKLTIKEAGRYANFLKQRIERAIMIPYTNYEDKMVEITEYHKKSEGYKEAEDTMITVEFPDKVDIEIDELNNVLDLLVQEKELLAEAIANAKKKLKVKVDGDNDRNLDAAIEYAKLLRNISGCYMPLFIDKREGKKKSRGQAYAVNVEGNQTPYYYEIETETTLKYDKDDFIKKNKEMMEKADKISEAVERAMTEKCVEFEPRFNYLDTLDDLVKKLRG